MLAILLTEKTARLEEFSQPGFFIGYCYLQDAPGVVFVSFEK